MDSALASHEAALRHLLVGVDDAVPESMAAWLAVAARRLSGSLTIKSQVKNTNEDSGESGKRGIFQLLCFERATTVSLDLGFLGLSLPPTGAFAQLTGLSLQRVRFHGPASSATPSPRRSARACGSSASVTPVGWPISPSAPGGTGRRGGGAGAGAAEPRRPALAGAVV
ncbi:hypothetical protein BAE44_0017430 [Dichanthelium oligosanthes]|uniref:Uncharacterized protein n=1 Tax=Dichanthelium oligosanthes TaxID=888268 RepID=A0A1E5V8V1_9POAL|nr:hypothetical protein BAE44_0017430 [Dichanthelium oligosanthes]